ncbi:MAG TPA: PP2C family protein-serine/threonine phosphatase [Thermoanaerobaculia bacterium]|nr:PP2C family protein-serine/threonine phosphatase [Thermoanaerobaculia bacterium]
MKPNSPALRLTAALAVGILVFAAGLMLARTWLPAWQPEPLPEERFFVERYRELARRAGVRLEPGEPRVSLTTEESNSPGKGKELDRLGPEELFSLGAGARIRIVHQAVRAEEGTPRQFLVQLSPSGHATAVAWTPVSARMISDAMRMPPATPEVRSAFLRLLLLPGESIGGERTDRNSKGEEENLLAIRGSDPPQHLRVQTQQGGIFIASRKLGSVETERDRGFPFLEVLQALPVILAFLAVPILFLVLLTKRRIDLVNGGILAGLTFLASGITLAGEPTLERLLEVLVPIAFLSLWVFLIWSAGESYLRSVQPGLTTELDALRSGRLGPRAGRALLYGLAGGALFAGLRLTALAGAAALPGLWSEDAGLKIPVFGSTNPLSIGLTLAGGVTMVLAYALRFLPARWAPWAAVLAGALALPHLDLNLYSVQIAVSLVLFGLLVWLCRRLGLLALLVTVVSSYLLPVAVFSGLHLSWLPVTFAFTAGLSAALLVLGLVGLARPERAELERVKPPAFIKRLEEERRLQYEMDLLARMQLGLLPERLPDVPGWEVAARSILATEAGGDLYDFLEDEDGYLWIAAGDVAGHGYSCAIVQAMTAAALTSLIAAGQVPSEVLKGVDRVIRRGGSHRHFTSLALLRLDPRTGGILLSNAGHPFPLLLAVGGEVEEIDLPGLPLGQGPSRKYADHGFEIPPGGTLVLCSDGLFEATDRQTVLYGYDRPQELLRSLSGQTAGQILEAVFADWRRHLGSEAPPDDTTVVVIRRKQAGRLSPAA